MHAGWLIQCCAFEMLNKHQAKYRNETEEKWTHWPKKHRVAKNAFSQMSRRHSRL